jgi:hypothetical protein
LSTSFKNLLDDYIEVEKVRSETIAKLESYMSEELEDPPLWWSEEEKPDSEGGLLGLLLTGTPEVGIAKWITEGFLTVVDLTLDRG